MKKLILLIVGGLFGFSSLAQITNTGLPFGITEGAILSAGNISSQRDINNNGLIAISGDYQSFGYSGNGTIKLTGANQTVDFGLQLAEIGNLTMNGSGTATFNNPLLINTALNLNSGIILLPSNNITLAESASITGGSADSYILGKLIRSGAGVMFFPVGTEQQYGPVTLDLQGNAATMGVNLIEENPNGIAGKGALAVSNQRYWELTDEMGNFQGAIVEAPLIQEIVAPTIEETVVLRNTTNDVYRSVGGSAFVGDLTEGRVTSTELVPAGRFTVGRFFDEQLRVNDSTALEFLYAELAGDNWEEKASWFETDLDDWFGITIDQKRVVGLDLPNNNLSGSITDQSLPQLSALTNFDLSDNQITGLPSLDAMNNLVSGDVSNNALTFISLENQSRLNQLNYIPQADVLEEETVIVELGETGNLDRQLAGNNDYSWFKNEEPFEGGINGILQIPDAIVDDEGIFIAEITNPSVPDLTLTTLPVEFFVSSLQRDRLALLALYESTNGPSWENPTGAPITGWDEDTDISQWTGVNLNSAGLRVQAVFLDNFGLAGEVPSQLQAMTFVENFDFGNNSLEKLPRLLDMPNLGGLDVVSNRLDYASIQKNLGIGSFTFNPQRPLQAASEIRVPQGTDYTFDFPMEGEDLTYRWSFQDQTIQGETDQSLVIDSVSFGDMGDYTLEITDQIVAQFDPSFSLSIEPQTLLATANLSGQVRNVVDLPVESGDIVLYKVAEELGLPYDSIGTFPLSANTFEIADIVLDDYIYLFLGNLEQYAPTYYVAAPTWSSADEIPLRKDSAQMELIAQTAPQPFIPGPDNDNTVRGYLEIDTDVFPPGTFNEGGRTLARRRVRRAGVAFSRLRSINRIEEDEYELVAYVLTDENGEYEVPNLPDGNYIISIEYPGIPMDTTSFVNFNLGEDGEVDENEITLAADITPDGIVVQQVEETGIYNRYFKGLNVFPVPAEKEVNITYDRLNADDIVLQLIDLSGSVKLEQPVPKGFTQHIQLDVRTLEAGIYLLTFVDAERGIRSITTRKLIVRR